MTVFALYVPEIPGERKEGERKKRGRTEGWMEGGGQAD